MPNYSNPPRNTYGDTIDSGYGPEPRRYAPPQMSSSRPGQYQGPPTMMSQNNYQEMPMFRLDDNSRSRERDPSPLSAEPRREASINQGQNPSQKDKESVAPP